MGTDRASNGSTLAPRSVHCECFPHSSSQGGDENGHGGLGFKLFGEPAFKAPAESAARSRTDDDDVCGLVGGDLADETGGVADGQPPLGAVGHAMLGRELREQTCASFSIALHRHAFVTLSNSKR
jgi:hypothetical protein